MLSKLEFYTQCDRLDAVWECPLPPNSHIGILTSRVLVLSTLTSYLVSVLGVSRVWGLGKVEGEGGRNQLLQAAGCKLSVQFATACSTLERFPPTLQSAGCPRDASAAPQGRLFRLAGVPGGGAPK